MLDTLLIVRGESARRFRLGIGVDLPDPLHESLGMIAPQTMLRETASRPTPSTTGWFFHVDAKNVIVTHLEPLVESNRVSGFRIRLLETKGKRASATLSCFRNIDHAEKHNFLGKKLVDCDIDQGRVRLEMTAHEWAEVEARWEGE